MNKFFVIANEEKLESVETSEIIYKYLTEKGKLCIKHISKDIKSEADNSFRFTNPMSVPDDTECVIVLGGDGTLIQAARDLIKKDIPLIGINFGKLGFLTEASKDMIIPTLDKLIMNDYQIESRMMLYGEVIRDGKTVAKDFALNDIVINRCGSLRVIDYKVYVNGQSLNHYTADGIIISTPTGSTAYNLSAGGPVVEPCASLMLLTPICPHTMNTRSIVLSSDDTIEIELCANKNESDEKFVFFDGDSEIKLKTGDKIVIIKSEIDTKIVKLSSLSFLEILRKKMES